MNHESRQKVNARVNRISGQVAGIKRMLEEDRYCIDILDQISAVRAALDTLGVELLTQHLDHCVLGHGTGSEHPQAAPMNRDELVQELNKALSRFLK